MARKYNRQIADLVDRYLTDNDFKYDFVKADGVFLFGVNLKGKLKNVRYVIGINESDYNVYVISPISADSDDADQMTKMAEFICRANYGLRNGNFELDFRDGELRYKCYVNCSGAMPDMEVVEDSINCPLAMYNLYGTGIVQILFNDMSAADAVALCEKGLHSSSRDDDDADDDDDDDDDDADNDDDGGDGDAEDVAARLLQMLNQIKKEHEGGSDD